MSHLFSQSLETEEPAAGTPIPPGYHWIWFTPAQLPGILGLDGTDASFNPDAPFTRRMWAGGSVEWPGAEPGQGDNSLLQVGDTVTEVTRLLSCEPKTIKKTGESMLVVGVLKEFRDSRGNLCVVDKRNWVFREALDPAKPAVIPKKPAELPSSEIEEQHKGHFVRDYNRTQVQLFRFSALTFNGHRIHYDKPWATQVEGHRDVVVHGPMNFLAMVDLWRDEMVKQGHGKSRDEILHPQKVEYRATSPVYAGEGYRVLMDATSGGKESEVQVVSNDGTKCMKGTITAW
jgi:hydroxyacyl-ACP dehydratase HTD2-like protein with hotdog domain